MLIPSFRSNSLHHPALISSITPCYPHSLHPTLTLQFPPVHHNSYPFGANLLHHTLRSARNTRVGLSTEYPSYQHTRLPPGIYKTSLPIRSLATVESSCAFHLESASRSGEIIPLAPLLPIETRNNGRSRSKQCFRLKQTLIASCPPPFQEASKRGIAQRSSFCQEDSYQLPLHSLNIQRQSSRAH